MTKKIIRPLKGIDVDSSVSRRDDNTIYIGKLESSDMYFLRFNPHYNVSNLHRSQLIHKALALEEECKPTQAFASREMTLSKSRKLKITPLVEFLSKR